jgi:hypothetical protein
LKYLFIILLSVILLSSCGKKEETDFVDEKVKTEQPETKPEEKPTFNPELQNKDNKLHDSSGQNKTSKNLVPDKIISPVEAGSYIGKFVTIQGMVVEVTKRDKVAYLNFIEKFPENPFSAVVFSSKYELFGDLDKYENKYVEVTGIVSKFRDKPQIVLNEPGQIKVR